jgi:glycosyltransferase involved in cell wall biosynthesis
VQRPFFTIIVVSLNPGVGLHKTLESITRQTFTDYEVLIKDGGSTDGSLDNLPDDSRIRLIRQPDAGIFDAMNQAVMESSGQFINFLNCGDTFYDTSVLETAAAAIRRSPGIRIFYGDVHKPGSRSGYTVYARRLSRYFLFNFPVCQQAWFVERDLLAENPFHTASAIGGDDIWFKRMVAGRREPAVKIPAVLVTYAGGGVSENSDRQAESQPFREAARREAFTSWERSLYGALFRIRTAFKSLVYDPFLWKFVRTVRQWKLKR